MRVFTKASAIFLLLIFTTVFSFAQLEATWTKSLTGNLMWQQVTSYGNYIVCTSSGLSGYDPATGEQLWTRPEFQGIAYEQMEELSGSPLIIINQNNNVSIIDPFSGEVKFTTQDAGLKDLKTKRVLYRANGILIAGTSTEDAPIMLMVDMGTGDVRWKIEEQFGRIVTVNELSDAETLIVTLFNIYKLNSTSGEIIWKNATSAEAEKMANSGMGELFQNFAEKATEGMEFVVRFFPHPNNEVFIVAIEQRNESTTSSGTVMVTYKNIYTAFNIADGERLWEQPIEEDGMIGDLAFYNDGFIIFPNNQNGRSRINYYTMNDAAPQWGKKQNGIPFKGGIYKYMKTEKGYLVVSGKSDNSFLSFLDPEQGILTFEKPVKINGEVVSTIESPKGIVYVTTEEVNVLNITTGEIYMKKPIKSAPYLIEQKDNLLYIFDIKDGILKSLNVDNASVSELSKEELKFEGKEAPNKIEIRDAGIFISSDQNVAMFGFDGALVFQEYYPAPREPGLKRALLYAQAVRAAYIGGVSYMAAGVYQGAGSQMSGDDPVGGAIVSGVGMAYEEMGNAASDFAKQSFAAANARFKATAEGRDFMIILATEDKTNYLMKVNKDNGQVEGKIDLGKEKDPKYAVDDVSGQVFIQDDASKVSSYQF